MPFPYVTPQAFRAALKDRFAALVKADPRLSIDELQRQFAYDRVLARCFTGTDSTRWVLKGAGALLARLEGLARHSKDIDLYYANRLAGTDRAVTALLEARSDTNLRRGNRPRPTPAQPCPGRTYTGSLESYDSPLGT